MFPSESSSQLAVMAVNVLTVSPFISSGDTQSKRVGQLVDFTTSRVLTPTYCSAADHAVQFWMVGSQAGKEMQFACSRRAATDCAWYIPICSSQSDITSPPSLFQVVHQLWRNDLLASKKIFPAHKYFYPPVQCTTETLYFIYNQLFTKFSSCSSDVLRFNLINNSVARCKKFNTSNNYRI